MACRAVAAPAWPAWERFQRDFIRVDGRVEDPSDPRRHTVSEAQAYALVFAWIADDRPAFERVLAWTENNLAGGDLTARLPAWRWGRRDDGSWGVVDANAASDADLWLAYVLDHAARQWGVARHAEQAAALRRRIARDEVVVVDGLGPVLLPGPRGFQADDGSLRLNPSYTPLFVLRHLARTDAAGPWAALADSSLQVLLRSAPRGLAPDWVRCSAAGRFSADTESRAIGSYDAIRVYLWAGALHADDPVRAALLRAFAPLTQRVAEAGAPPERVDTVSGQAEGSGSSGFSAALLPWLAQAGRPDLLAAQRERAQRGLQAEGAGYYDQALGLFGLGWLEGRWRVAADGSMTR